MHTMDETPPQSTPEAVAWEYSDNVTLHYADGSEAIGFKSGWTGWQVWRDGLPVPCEDESTQPIGWSELEVKP